MADIQSNINVNINTSEALANVRTLQRQISAFYESMARSGAAASAAASNMQSNLINTINQTGKFSASIKSIASTTESFTNSLEKNKLSMGQYFKFAGGASKTFGKFFKTEMDTIDKVARERVKTLQTQYVRLGRDASGALKSIAIRPLSLDMEDLGTKTAIAAQKQQLMNQLLKQGSTNLLNFGKNTQWAGRQLMVGFTIPLSMVGTAAAKTFMQMEEQAIKFRRVYGDSMTPTAETDAMIDQIRQLASEFTKYGVAAEKTMELAATAAAAGKQGADLTAQVREANRLAVLGQVEQQDALNTTISITNAFGVAAEDLANKINFLNAVENQTVTSIEDLTIAVPKAGPVVQQLGGDVEDLTFFLTAMKEGGINASEGANALKSGLAALINPTGKASDMLAGFGINVKNIVESNKGDVKGLVLDFASALDTLDPLSRARAIEQMFGKFQFSRLSTLFQNVIKDGSQASRVLDLTSQSSSQLADLASKELGTVAASSMFKFQKAVEDLKIAIAPIGEIFLNLVTPVIEFGTKILDNFNKLDSGAKNFILGLTVVVGGLGPVLLMTFGLLANGIANIVKGFMLVRNIFTKSGQSSKFLGDQTEYMTQQQLEAASVAASLEQVHQRLEQRFTSEAIAVDRYTQALQRANNANLTFQGRNAGAAGAKPKKYAKGVVSVPGPKGAGDIIPAMLAPGEAVVPAKQASKYSELIKGIVADNIPGFQKSNVKVGPMPTGGSQAQKSKTQFAHVVENAIEVTAQELLNVIDTAKAAGKNVSIKLEKQIRGIVADIDPNKKVRLYGGLGFKQAPGLNVGMRQGGAVKTDDFLQDFIKQGPEKFNQSIKFGGGNLKDSQLQEHLKQYDNEIIKLTEKFKSLSNGSTITSDQFGKIEAEARKILPEFSDLRQALNAAETGLYDVRANISEAEFKKAGISLQSKEGSGTKSARLSTGAYVRQGGNRASSNRLIEGVGLATFQGISSTTVGVEKGIDQAIQRNSPPKRAIQIGRDYGLALNGALRESIPKVKVAGAAFGLAATTSMTTITPAMRQHLMDSAGKIIKPYIDAQGNVSSQSQRRTRSRNKQTTTVGFIGPLQQSGVSDNAGNQEGVGEEADRTNTKLSRLGNTVRNTSFAMTSLAAAGTMAGGTIGELSNGVMQFSGVIFIATTIMDLLIAAQQRQIISANAVAAGNAAAAKTGILSTLSNFLMFSKGKAGGMGFIKSLKDAIVPLGGAAKAAGGGLKGFINVIKIAGGNILRFAGAALRFVPVVGWIVTAISAFVLITNLINEAKERERLATEGVADATENTAKEMDNLAELLGKDRTKTAFEKVAAGIDPTASSETASLVERLKTGDLSQQFKDTYGADINAMKDMTQRELKTYQDTLAISLQASGDYAKDEIDAVIQALQSEAKRTDVKFDFASIDITSKNTDSFKNSIKAMTTDVAAAAANPQSTESISIINSKSRAFYDTLNSLNTALQQNVISTDQYNARVQILKDGILSLPNAATVATNMMNTFAGTLEATRPEMAALLPTVSGASNQLFVMGAVANGAIPDIVALTKVIGALKIVADVDAGTRKEDAVSLAARQTIAEYSALAAERAKKIGEGFDTGTQAINNQKTAIQSATEELSKNINGVKESTKAYDLLSKAGFSAADAFALAQNPTLATALATTKVGTAKWKELVKLAKEFVSISKDKTLTDSLVEFTKENQMLTKFEKLSAYLQQMGLDSEDIGSIIGDPELANAFIKASEDGAKGFAKINKYIAKIAENKELKISILPLEDQFKERLSKVMNAFSAKENALEIQFKVDTRANQNIIRKAQKDISALNFQADDYEAGLTRLEDGESAINEKYDNRLEALDKIITANDRIADQNKEELNVFQMVARGDIAGAAAGLAQLQQQKAKNALEAKKESLQTQRTNELESLTAEVMVNGQKVRMTRNQIEENLKNIKQQIFNIEENIIEPAQRQVDLRQELLDDQIEALRIEGLTKDEWVNIEAKIDLAKTTTTEYLKELEKALAVAKQIPGALAGGATTKPDPITEKDFPKTKTDVPAKIKTSDSNVPGGSNNLTPAEQKKIDQINLNASTQKYPPGYAEYVARLGEAKKNKTGSTISSVLESFKKNYAWLNQNYRQQAIPTGRDLGLFGDKSFWTGWWPDTRTAGGRELQNFKGYSGFASGGMVMPKKFAAGGFAMGTDTVPAMLTPGEFVVSKYGVDNYGVDNLKAINNGTAGANSVYNGYNINVNVKSNSNPDQIANAVMTQIRQVNSQQVRGNKF